MYIFFDSNIINNMYCAVVDNANPKIVSTYLITIYETYTLGYLTATNYDYDGQRNKDVSKITTFGRTYFITFKLYK